MLFWTDKAILQIFPPELNTNRIDSIMASKFFTPYRSKDVKISLLLHHKELMMQHYDFLIYKIKDNVLVCTGYLPSKDYKNNYKVEIRCVAGKEPWCKIIEPAAILPSKNIHMYEDHSICLHFPSDMRWTGHVPIYKYTIPWIIEWVHYYELYLVNGGVWEGPESPAHLTEEDKNLTEDVEDV
jgi:hypothetical protein